MNIGTNACTHQSLLIYLRILIRIIMTQMFIYILHLIQITILEIFIYLHHLNANYNIFIY